MTGFFPSRTITFYMMRLFLVRTFGILAALVLVLQALDLLGQTGNILAYKGNGQAQVWHYVALRVPQIVATFLPFAVLLGTLLTLAQMNQNSEIIAMKAAGLSAHQVLAPLVMAAFGVAVVSFAFNDRIVSRTTAELTQWQDVEYGPLPIDRGDRSNVWVLSQDDLLDAAQVKGSGAKAQLGNVTFYERDRGALQAVVTAPLATYAGNGWRLRDGQRFDVASGKVKPIGNAVIAPGVRPDQLTLAEVDPDSESFGGLMTAIGDLNASGRPTKALEGSLWHKLSGPLSAILMPILGAVAGFGLARSGQLVIRAVIGMGLGFAYFVADNFALAMGNLGAYPPFLAAWAPFLLFLLIGEAVLVRTEE